MSISTLADLTDERDKELLERLDRLETLVVECREVGAVRAVRADVRAVRAELDGRREAQIQERRRLAWDNFGVTGSTVNLRQLSDILHTGTLQNGKVGVLPRDSRASRASRAVGLSHRLTVSPSHCCSLCCRPCGKRSRTRYRR